MNLAKAAGSESRFSEYVEGIASVIISPDGKYYAYDYVTRVSELFVADRLR